MSIDGHQLQERILTFIGHGSASGFEALALDLFAFQFEHNQIYHSYCERLGVTPSSITDWTQFPAVPTQAFKDFEIVCFPAAESAAVFHTSGTTRAQAGKHYFKTLALYDAAIRPNFNQHLLPDGARLPMLILTPSPAEAPHSSLAHMMGVVAGDDAEYFVEGETLHLERLTQRLCELQWESQPVLLLGTAFAFVHLFDHLQRTNTRFELASGSRVMETGGFKGRTREVTKAELHHQFVRFLGITADRVINEYGMTELSTQFYDESLRIGRASNRKAVPAWARVLVMDPQTGTPAQPGKKGLIRVLDLANCWSTVSVQTEDFGIAHDAQHFEILGRAAHVEVRGCSLNAESLNRK